MQALLAGMTSDCFNDVAAVPKPFRGPKRVAERYRETLGRLGYLLDGLDHFEHGETTAVAAVERDGFAAAPQVFNASECARTRSDT